MLEKSGNNQTKYFKEMQMQLVSILFTALREEPKRYEYHQLSKSFFTSLDLAFVMKSSVMEERELAINLCSLLLHHDPKLTMDDLVSFDLQARDVMNKSANNKIWQALN